MGRTRAGGVPGVGGEAVSSRPGGSQRDPLGQDGHFFRRQLARRGHLETIIVDRIDQQAFSRLAGNDRRTGLAALEDRVERVEPEPTLLLLVPVARVAFLGQERADILLEERLASRTSRSTRFRRRKPDLPGSLLPTKRSWRNRVGKGTTAGAD